MITADGYILIPVGTGTRLTHGVGRHSIMDDGSGTHIEDGYGALTQIGVLRGFPGDTAQAIADGRLYLQVLDSLLVEVGLIMGPMWDPTAISA